MYKHKSLKILKWYSEVVIRKTNNTMAKRDKWTKRQEIVDQTLHRPYRQNKIPHQILKIWATQTPLNAG